MILGPVESGSAEREDWNARCERQRQEAREGQERERARNVAMPYGSPLRGRVWLKFDQAELDWIKGQEQFRPGETVTFPKGTDLSAVILTETAQWAYNVNRSTRPKGRYPR